MKKTKLYIEGLRNDKTEDVIELLKKFTDGYYSEIYFDHEKRNSFIKELARCFEFPKWYIPTIKDIERFKTIDTKSGVKVPVDEFIRVYGYKKRKRFDEVIDEACASILTEIVVQGQKKIRKKQIHDFTSLVQAFIEEYKTNGKEVTQYDKLVLVAFILLHYSIVEGSKDLKASYDCFIMEIENGKAKKSSGFKDLLYKKVR